MKTAEDVLSFWFADGMQQKWFVKDAAFDELVLKNLGYLCEDAAEGALDHWGEHAKGAVALVILLDQVPRNIYRGDGRAFAGDAAALAVTRAALAAGFDRDLSQVERCFLHLPLEHSEDLVDQELCCDLMARLDENPKWHDYALKHRAIIARFGRFPHRNAVLGRKSTPEEEAFLREEGSSF